MATSLPVQNIDELKAIIKRMDEISPLIAILIDFEARSGLRYVDLSKLTFDDLMINGTVRKSFTIVQSKAYNARMKPSLTAHLTEAEYKKRSRYAREESKVTIHVNEGFEALIRRLYLINGANKLAFQSGHHSAKEGKAISIQYINRSLKKIAFDMGLPYPLSTHSMRKSFAMFLLNMGATVKVVKESLGQASIGSTEHYLKTFADETKDFTTRIDY